MAGALTDQPRAATEGRLMHLTGPEGARRTLDGLRSWLLTDAYPVWGTKGFDESSGGFHELLAADGPVPGVPRRARVQLRQIYCFARAPQLGWKGDARRLVTAGLDYFLAHYRRPDGLFRMLVAPGGAVVSDRALLYDQAFALLAFAEAHRLLGPDSALDIRADSLLDRLYGRFARADGGFRSETAVERPLASNPHMHLLEAALSWQAIGAPRWRLLAEELAALAVDRMIDRHSGVMREQFDERWAPFPGPGGRIIEPGHQFEWAWLLLRCAAHGSGERIVRAAAQLMETGERPGVCGGVAINSMLDDFSAHDLEARLWPQTESLKAHALTARMSGEPRHWQLAARSAGILMRYLDAGSRGLWHDRRCADGTFKAEPSPASSFYHLVCAVGELGAALADA